MSTPAPPELCVSVQRSQSSITRGQTATYVVHASTQNGPASDVSVALTAQPSSQGPTFSSGCTAGDGTASCNLGSMTAGQTVSLDAQIAVASTATSVSSVTLTATASVVTSAKWTPPAAAETTAVTAAAAPAATSSKSTKSTKSTKNTKSSKKTANSGSASPDTTQLPALPLGPIPALNGAASQLIGAGSAANLFPTIGPSPGTSRAPAVQQARPGKRDTAPVSDASPVSVSTPVFTAQAAGLIALGLAIMLIVTRLSVRRRPGKPRS